MDWLSMLLGINPASAGPLGATPPLGGYGINQPPDMPPPPGSSIVPGSIVPPGYPLPGTKPGGIGSDYPTLGASLAGAPYQAPGTTGASVGGTMGNLPVPLPRPPSAGQGQATAAAAQSQGGLGGGGFYGGSPETNPNLRPMGGQRPGGPDVLGTLRGIQAPQNPQAQTVRTPPPPQIARPGPSELINLLSSLGIGPQQAVGMGLFRR